MKKLLHERLREYGSNCRADYTDWISQRDANELANEIEKYYIPRPRFDSGEPVQFGEEFADYSGNPHTLHEIRYRDKDAAGLGAKCLLEANTTSPKDYDGISFNLYDGTFVKRPEPKVLDADGVEIKVGDTVYDTSNGKALKVTEVLKSSVGVIGELGCGSILAEHITHREPDSLEKLRDDMKNHWSESISVADSMAFHEWADRLTAIMERDA